MGSDEGEKGKLFLKEKLIVELSKLAELFVMVSTNDMITLKYFHNWELIMLRSKYYIPKECRIGDKCLLH